MKVDYIPLEQNLQGLQICFNGVCVAALLAVHLAWVRRNRREPSVNKIIVNLYFGGKCFAFAVTLVCLIVGCATTSSEKAFAVVSQISENVNFIAAKTLPSYCVIMQVGLSLGLLSCPLKVNLVKWIVFWALLALFLCQSAFWVKDYSSEDAFTKEVADIISIVLTVIATGIQTLWLCWQMRRQSVIFTDQRVVHFKAFYAAICYDVSRIIQIAKNTIMLAFGHESAKGHWFYWILMDFYQAISVVCFCFAYFPPQWLSRVEAKPEEVQEILTHDEESSENFHL